MKTLKYGILFTLIILLALIPALPTGIYAETLDQKTVRVGWYDSTYNSIDENGFRSGYAYEYQLKLGAYNGWTYEYVRGSWPDLLHMLENGEIDLMSDVSYTPKREESMFFPSLPMGSEEYYLFVAPGNEEINSSNPLTVNGKRVGVNLDSVQADFFREWAAHNNIDCEIVLVSTPESESLKMMHSGEIDAYVTVDSFMDPSRAVPVFKIGSSDYYFAVSKARPDLLEDLNFALSRIQDENRYYNTELYEKYIRRTGANAFLTTRETDWLAKHGAIKVGYQDNYLAFCAVDKKTGEMTGLLKDYLDIASDVIPNAHIDFKTVAFPTAEDAMIALEKGQVDCVFPANFSGYEAETQGIYMTPTVMTTEMYAVVRKSDPAIYDKGDNVVVAVNEGNLNYEAFLIKHYPNWEKKYYADTEACLKAIANGEADCIIISNYRYNNISKLCEKYSLMSYSLGIALDYSFAVEKGRTELYSIMAKANGLIPETSINASVAHYITEDAKLTLTDIITSNLPIVMTVIAVVLLIILGLLLQNMWAVKKAKNLISATETDGMTGLYNRDYFFQYANRMRSEHREKERDAMVFNIEQFHAVNALYGRDLGDQILLTLGNEVQSVANENNGIAGRFGADRFDIYCDHRTEYQSIYDRIQSKIDELTPNGNVRLRMGVMPSDPDLDPVQQFDRARTACNMGRGNYNRSLTIYDETISGRESFEQRLVADFKKALEAHEFHVYYQPKYDITGEKPKLVSAEALVRWYHPEFGLVSPDDFIPLLEKNGQIKLLDEHVWWTAAKKIDKWKKQYGVTIPISVNISRVDVYDPAIEETLENIITGYELDRGDLKLEVTESAYTENSDQVIRVFGRLRSKGYVVEMDDFGTGYSSLNMLSSMPIDVLKMDIAFVRNIDRDEKARKLVAFIMDIAKSLNFPVIAEGVETEKQLAILKELGCPMVQGFYFSRPLPGSEFEKNCIVKEL